MAEVAEQRAVGLAHGFAGALALGVVGLGEVDRDQPVGMAGDDLRGLLPARLGEEVEGEPGLLILELADHGQAEPEQAIDQPVLGGLQALPAQEMVRRAEVGDRAVEPAGLAEGVPALGRHQPVAGVMDGIGAEALQRLGRDQRAPALAVERGERAECGLLGQIAQDMLAALAPGVLEVQQLAAMLALEQLHGRCPSGTGRGLLARVRDHRGIRTWVPRGRSATAPAPPSGGSAPARLRAPVPVGGRCAPGDDLVARQEEQRRSASHDEVLEKVVSP